MRRERWLAVACILAGAMLARDVEAQTDASAQAKAGGDAGAAAAQSPHGNDGDEQSDDPHAAPHGRQGHGNPNAMFEAPEDGSIEDPTLPPGTISVHIQDASGKPMPGTNVTLGILYNSVAKGESRKRVNATTDAQGRAVFDKLDTGSGVAYRAMVLKEGATFEIPPFQLSAKSGMRAILHVYPIENEIEKTMVVSQAILLAEVKDDRIQIQEAFKIYNFGKTAWVPNDLVIPLPEEFTAFNAQQGMTDIGVEAVPKKGVRIKGTFPPGQHMVEFQWQLPYSGQAEVRFEVGTSPHMAAARVIAPASKDMRLDVPGFPLPESQSDGRGQRALITEKQLRREDPPMKSIAVVIRGLPTEGPGKLIATLLSAGGLVFGLVLGTKKPEKRDRNAERQRLLEELESLERARLAGDVGPKTYERARRDILDAIARGFAEDAPTPSPAKSKKRRAS